jgi:hypothetical protein
VILREAAAKIETSDGRVGIVTRSLERIHVRYAINLRRSDILFACPYEEKSKRTFVRKK